jgi:hypothetical protein
MAKQTINIGTAPNDGTGTPLRTSFDYTNQNFTEIYTALGGGVALPGATTQVIFNDGGTNLAGDAGLVYNKTTDALTVAGLVTAGSATITGDLTVRTTRLTTTTTGVGIGTASPILPLDVRGAAGAGALFLRTTDPTAPVASAYIQTPVSTGFSSTVPMYGFWYQNCGMGNPASENLSWIINSSEAMRLNSTGLGVGVSPTFNIHARGTTDGRIQVEGASGYGMVFVQASNGNSAQLQLNSNGGSGRRYVVASNTSGQFLIGDETAVATRLLIDSAGNVGIAVTPSAWTSSVRAIDIVSGGLGVFSGGITHNAYFDNTDARWEYKGTGPATYYNLQTGVHQWFVAASGTANNPITTFATAAMTLDASGNLILLSSNTPATLTTNGQLTVNATSNTNLRFSYRGSDGVTRVANLTLA